MKKVRVPIPGVAAVFGLLVLLAACDPPEEGPREEPAAAAEDETRPGAEAAGRESTEREGSSGQEEDVRQETPPGEDQDARARADATLRVGGIPVTVEIADDPEERRRGLMDRESLPEDHGMLFVYSQEEERSFWMRDTPLALDIAFIDRSGLIVDIQQMEPRREENYTSRVPAMYALEMERGWFAENDVGEGDRVEF